MGYALGVDLGTTWTACAVARAGGPEVVALGDHGSEVPSVLFLREDGTFLVGEAAERRGLTAPQRLAREFKRRTGDPTPLLLAGSPYSAHALTATLLRWVVERVTEREGTGPDRLVVTCPANWGPYKRESLQHAIELADVGAAQLCSEPEAAALRYASLERLHVGDVVAVYDLGGGTFDTAVLARTVDGFRLLGAPAGIEQLGGVDFDDALLSHVLDVLGPDVDELDPDDDATATALARLRRDCVHAKEALSQDTEAVVPVGLPGLHTSVRVLRSEFEDLVRPPVAETVRAVQRALRAAEVEAEQLSAVLLAGGSSRIPLVAQTLSAELGRPVAVDAHPKHLVALGAALHGAPAAAAPPPAPTPPMVVQQPSTGAAAPAGTVPGPRSGVTAPAASAPAAAPSAAQQPSSARRPAAGRASRRELLPALLAMVAALLVVASVGLGDWGVDLGGAGPRPLPPEVVDLGGVDPAQGGVVRVDTRDSDESVSVDEAPLGAVVAVRPRVLGVPLSEASAVLPADRKIRPADRGLGLPRTKWLLAGRSLASVTVTAPGERSGRGATVVVEPARPPPVTVPSVGGLVLLLFCGANLEALAGPVRRGRRLRPATLAAAGALGAGAGVALALLGWAVHGHLLLPRVPVVCAVLGAGAAACGLRLLAARAATRAA